jgi:hypothetical protein
MIALSSDCLLFRTPCGESVPCSADMLSQELAGTSLESIDPDIVHHAASAVFHYFKYELGRQTVTVGEFAGALETVLQGVAGTPKLEATPHRPAGVVESDLCGMAREVGEGCELFFFPRLRAELRQQLQHRPRVLRFHGLRACVKQLTGARRWNLRCRALEGQIVAYLQQCLGSEPRPSEVALVVE